MVHDYLIPSNELRPGVEVKVVFIPKSSKETTGLNRLLLKNISLHVAETEALGLMQIGNKPSVVDLLLLDYPTNNPKDAAVWENIIYRSNEAQAPHTYSQLRNSVAPELSPKELSENGITVNGELTKDYSKTPRSILLQAYLTGLKENKRPLIITGHGGVLNDSKVVGSRDDLGFDYCDLLYSSIDTTKYSLILDTTCADKLTKPPFSALQPPTTVIAAASDVIAEGAIPAELQAACWVYQNGQSSLIEWRNIAIQRRMLGMYS